MYRFYTIILLLLVLAGCYHDAPQESFDMSKVISQDSMVSLLTDLQLVDGTVNLRAKEGKPMADYASAYFQKMLDKHAVSKDEFNESIRYYSFYIEKMDEIYEQVIINLSLREAEVLQPDQRE